MSTHVVRLSLVALVALVGVACDAERDDNTARVTIDMRCASNGDCPTGFECEIDAEHGAPISTCQSTDATMECPRGYETHIGYGQTFCTPRLRIESRGAGASAVVPSRGRSGHH
jgi:hypothetical protein